MSDEFNDPQQGFDKDTQTTYGGTVRPVWEVDEKPNPNFIFKINDVVFEIPPQNITVHKEDLIYSYKTLRTASSTKIASGHGVCHVSINAVFTPDLLLHLHRLIVQFRHSPFCYVENRFLRESIVPTWPIWQNMAFTMTSINIHALPKNPGSFSAEIELRWFNYFPYTPNYLFRDEWKTQPMDIGDIRRDLYRHVEDLQLWQERNLLMGEGTATTDIRRKVDPEGQFKDKQPFKLGCATIPLYQQGFGDLNPIIPYTRSDNVDNLQESIRDAHRNRILLGGKKDLAPIWSKSFIGNQAFINTWSGVSKNREKKPTWTLDDLYQTHAGVIFDLMPLPNRMIPANPVQDPSYSRIYVRYINLLQQQALRSNFAIDIALGIKEHARDNPDSHVHKEDYWKVWWDFTYGERGGKGNVVGLHTGGLPQKVRAEVIRYMLTYTHRVYFYYDQYTALQYQSTMNKLLRKNLKKLQRHGMQKQAGGTIAPALEILPKAPEQIPDDKPLIFRDFGLVIDDKRQPDRWVTTEPVSTFVAEMDSQAYLPPWDYPNPITMPIHLQKPPAECKTWFAYVYDKKGAMITYRSPFWNENVRNSYIWAKDERTYLKWYPPVPHGRVTVPRSWQDRPHTKKDPWETSEGQNPWNQGRYGELVFGSLRRFHNGIDIQNEIPNQGFGMPVFAIEDGILTHIMLKGQTPHSGGTIAIRIKHGTILADAYLDEPIGQKYESVYEGIDVLTANHLISSNYIGVGHTVRRGQLIGFVGGMHNSEGEPHLHFEMWKNGAHIDPWPELKESIFSLLCDTPSEIAEEQALEASRTITSGVQAGPVGGQGLVVPTKTPGSVAVLPVDTGPITKTKWYLRVVTIKREDLYLTEDLFTPVDDAIFFVNALQEHLPRCLDDKGQPFADPTPENLYINMNCYFDVAGVDVGKRELYLYQVFKKEYTGGSPPDDEAIEQIIDMQTIQWTGLWYPTDESDAGGNPLYVDGDSLRLPSDMSHPTGDNRSEDGQWLKGTLLSFASLAEGNTLSGLYSEVDAFGVMGDIKFSDGGTALLETLLANKGGTGTGEVWEHALNDKIFNNIVKQREKEQSEVGKSDSLPKEQESVPPAAVHPEFDVLCEKPKPKTHAPEPEKSTENFLNSLTENEQRIIAVTVSMKMDGWTLYDKNTHLTNVWKRPLAVAVDKHNFQYEPGTQIGYNSKRILTPESLPGVEQESFPKFFSRHGLIKEEGLVLTGCSGGLRHIVATIPILGHEFPTHQHLGSVEPTYSLELTSIDRTSPRGDGLGQHAGALEAMRQELQKNARDFRGVPDGHGMICDTFMTRFFGSFNIFDITGDTTEISEGDMPEGVTTETIGVGDAGLILLKRNLISSMTTATLEGQPGASVVSIQMEETNPYETESLQEVHNPGPPDNQKYKLVLNALLNMSGLDDSDDDLKNHLTADIRDAKKLRALIDAFGYTVASEEEAKAVPNTPSWSWAKGSPIATGDSDYHNFLEDKKTWDTGKNKLLDRKGVKKRVLVVIRSDEKQTVVIKGMRDIQEAGQGKFPGFRERVVAKQYVKTRAGGDLLSHDFYNEDDDVRSSMDKGDKTYTAAIASKFGWTGDNDIVTGQIDTNWDRGKEEIRWNPEDPYREYRAEVAKKAPLLVSITAIRDSIAKIAKDHPDWFNNEQGGIAFQSKHDSSKDPAVLAIDLTNFYAEMGTRPDHIGWTGLTGQSLNLGLKPKYMFLRKIQKFTSYFLAEEELGGFTRQEIFKELFEVTDERAMNASDTDQSPMRGYAFAGNMYKNFMYWLWLYMMNYLQEGHMFGGKVDMDEHARNPMQFPAAIDVSLPYITELMDPDFMFDQIQAHNQAGVGTKERQNIADLLNKYQLNRNEWLPYHLHKRYGQGNRVDLPEYEDDPHGSETARSQLVQRQVYNPHDHLKGIDISDVPQNEKMDIAWYFDWNKDNLGSQRFGWTQRQAKNLQAGALSVWASVVATLEGGLNNVLKEYHESFNKPHKQAQLFGGAKAQQVAKAKDAIKIQLEIYDNHIKEYTEDYISGLVGIGNFKSGFRKAFIDEYLPWATPYLTPTKGVDKGDEDAIEYYGVNSDMFFLFKPQLLDTARWLMIPDFHYLESKISGLAEQNKKWKAGIGAPLRGAQKEWLKNANKAKNLGALSEAPDAIIQLLKSNSKTPIVKLTQRNKLLKDFFQSDDWKSMGAGDTAGAYDIWKALAAEGIGGDFNTTGQIIANTRAWQEYNNEPYAPHKKGVGYKAHLKFERRKLNHIKDMLKALGDQLLRDVEFLKEHNLMNLLLGQGSAAFTSGEFGGIECYPDMTLPPHPYYPPGMFGTNPDFYMWSIYEDAPGSTRGAIVDAVSKRGEKYLYAAYEHLSKMQKEGLYKQEDLFKIVSYHSTGSGLSPSGENDAVRNKHIESILESDDYNMSTAKEPRKSSHGKLGHMCENSDKVYTLYPGGDQGSIWVKPNEATGDKGHFKNRRLIGRTEYAFRDIRDTPNAPAAGHTVAKNIDLQLKDSSYKRVFADWNQEKQNLKNQILGETNKKTRKILEAKLVDTEAEQKKYKSLMAIPNKKPKPGQETKHSFQSIRMQPFSLTDGTIQNSYPMRVDPEVYQRLLSDKVREVEKMFGSRAGYTGEYIHPQSKIGNQLQDTAIATLAEYTHAYDRESLKKLAKDSAVDILSEKLTMRRAFPTFKLYFVEEDEMQSRWLNLDDFYSFNGVKEFTIHKSRKNAADTAVIVLQNISGTLDGTKRDVITDLDYLAQKESTEVAIELERLRRKPGNTDVEIGAGPFSQQLQFGGWMNRESRDTPFGAVVMRPGLNVQLRCGYSNDPEMLEVMLSGRVTDVAWNTVGDLCEITVQSFGVELTQIRKGLNLVHGTEQFLMAKNPKTPDQDEKEFPTTHHLLGYLMLSPELKHFGRWEHNNWFQGGEAQDAALDFFDYSGKSPWGIDSIGVISRFVHEHWMFVAGVSTLLDVMTFLPTGWWLAPIRGAKTAVTGVWGAATVGAFLKGGVQAIGKVGLFIPRRMGGLIRTVGGGKLWRWMAAGKHAIATVGAKATQGRFMPWMAKFKFGRSRAIALRPLRNEAFDQAISYLIRIKDIEGIKRLLIYGRKAGQQLSSKAPGKKGYLQVPGGKKMKAVAATDDIAPLLKKGAGDSLEGARAILKEWGLEGMVKTTSTGTLNRMTAWLSRLTKGTKEFNAVHGMDAFRGIFEKTIAQKLTQGVAKLDRALINEALDLMQIQARTNKWGILCGLSPSGAFAMTTGYTAGGVGTEVIKQLLYHTPGSALRKLIFIGSGVLGIEAIWDNVISPMVSFKLDKIRRSYIRAKTYYMLSPQDDNLYPPSPAYYIRLRNNTNWDSVADTTGDTLGALLAVFSLGMHHQEDTDAFKNWLAQLDDPPAALMNKRLTLAEASYTLYNSTIWDVFHEMSLRHPGHVYGARPYGNKFQYRMFFGIPSQRYWSKPASAGFVMRMNDLRDSIKTGTEGEGNTLRTFNTAVTPEKYALLYSMQDAVDLKRHAEEKVASGGDFNEVLDAGPTSGEADTESDDFRETVSNQVRLYMTTRVLKEYLTGLELRFVPFRRYHTITDKLDIIRNNIRSSEHNVVNCVDVTFYNWGKDRSRATPFGSTVIKAQSMIPEEEIKMQSVNYPNCKGYRSSLRYGMGALLHTMRDMYRGEILVLGNPRIRPWDVCLVEDEYNDMAGPVEVEAVTHIFSHETGFITEIKPNALVAANEISTWPIIEALKAFQMLAREHKEGKEKIDVGGISDRQLSILKPALVHNKSAAYFQAIMRDDLTLWQVWKHYGSKNSKEWQKYLIDRHGLAVVAEGEDLTQTGSGKYSKGMIKFDVDKNTNAVKKIPLEKRFPGISLHANEASSPSYIRPVAIFGAALGGLLAMGLTRKLGMGVFGAMDKHIWRLGNEAVLTIPSVLGKTGSAFTKFFGSLATLGIGYEAGAMGGSMANQLFRSEDNQGIASSLSQWLVSGSVLFTKCLEEEVIQVIPLLIHGRPMISGLTTKDPVMAWKNKVGQIVNDLADTIDGSVDVVRDFTAHTWGFWRFIDKYWDQIYDEEEQE